MKFENNTRGLWLRARYREGPFEGEACLLTYDDDSFDDLLVSGDIKEVFEKRASTAHIFIVALFLSALRCRNAFLGGSAVQRASAYLAGKTGKIFLIEVHSGNDDKALAVLASAMTWNQALNSVQFSEPAALDAVLREGWLFDLFDSNEGLVIAPAGVHFRKGSKKHTTTFLRAANALTSSAGCGLFALFTLAELKSRQPRRIFVDTAPLLSVAFALSRLARTHNVWTDDVPARSFGSYGGIDGIGRLSTADVFLVSATTSGSLTQELIKKGAGDTSVVTFFYLAAKGVSQRPLKVLCDLTTSPSKGYGYQPLVNYFAADCTLCKSSHLLVGLEGDQFLLQQRQHRLLKIFRKTQSDEARKTLAELCATNSLEVVLRPERDQATPIIVNEDHFLAHDSVRRDFIRLIQRYCPQPLSLVVRVNISDETVLKLAQEAGVAEVFQNATIIDWSKLPQQQSLELGKGVLVMFGCLSSQTQARSINATLRSIVNDGNVAYLSALTLAASPEQYQDLKIFLGFGKRGPETFTYREARRLALPGGNGVPNPWADELEILNTLSDSSVCKEIYSRRELLSTQTFASDNLFLPGKDGALAIKRDFVYLDTKTGCENISQATVFTVVVNLLCASRSNDRELAAKPGGVGEILELTHSVYGHVLLSPETFLTYNDAVLKASFLRAARTGELFYEVDEFFSEQVAGIVLAELAGWPNGTGEALPEMLLALAANRLRLRERDRINIRCKALAAELPQFLTALAEAITTC